MKALILAAGLGTRLGMLTTSMPKPMLALEGRPLLAYTVDWLRSHGVREIAINLHHAPEVIPAYFGDGSGHGVHIAYSYEPTLLGTAGAARRLSAFLDERFVVVYGDVFTNLNLQALEAFHLGRMRRFGVNPHSAAATLALYRVLNPTECGLVDMDEDGRVRRFVEKPPAHQVFTDLANAGVLICEPEVAALAPDDRPYDFSRDLFPAMLRSNLPVFAAPIGEDEFVIDIGNVDAYARAQSLVVVSIPAEGLP